MSDWRWQWVFPSDTIWVDLRTGWRGRLLGSARNHAGRPPGMLDQASDRPQPPALLRHTLAGDQV